MIARVLILLFVMATVASLGPTSTLDFSSMKSLMETSLEAGL